MRRYACLIKHNKWENFARTDKYELITDNASFEPKSKLIVTEPEKITKAGIQ